MPLLNRKFESRFSPYVVSRAFVHRIRRIINARTSPRSTTTFRIVSCGKKRTFYHRSLTMVVTPARPPIRICSGGWEAQPLLRSVFDLAAEPVASLLTRVAFLGDDQVARDGQTRRKARAVVLFDESRLGSECFSLLFNSCNGGVRCWLLCKWL